MQARKYIAFFCYRLPIRRIDHYPKFRSILNIDFHQQSKQGRHLSLRGYRAILHSQYLDSRINNEGAILSIDLSVKYDEQFKHF